MTKPDHLMARMGWSACSSKPQIILIFLFSMTAAAFVLVLSKPFVPIDSLFCCLDLFGAFINHVYFSFVFFLSFSHHIYHFLGFCLFLPQCNLLLYIYFGQQVPLFLRSPLYNNIEVILFLFNIFFVVIFLFISGFTSTFTSCPFVRTFCFIALGHHHHYY